MSTDKDITIQTWIKQEGLGNDKCADCRESNPDWGVYNQGVIVCIKCAGIHRELGTHISKVRSIKYDTWTADYLTQLTKGGGNELVNSILEARKPCYFVNGIESDCEEIRKYFIQHKYQLKAFRKTESNKELDEKTDYNKVSDNMSLCLMPSKVNIMTFINCLNKKRVYLQIFMDKLYYFNNKCDSYTNNIYLINNLDCHICENKDKYDHTLLNINLIKPNKKLFQLKSINCNDNQLNTSQLIEFLHNIRKNGIYYDYYKNIKKNNKNIIDQPPLKTFYYDIFKNKNCTILGFANKTGGSKSYFRKRWFVLYENYLYYFKKEHYTPSKKPTTKESTSNYTPQGYINLTNNCDIIQDNNKNRTNKENCFLIITKDRTYYIQPLTKFKQFYNILSNYIESKWNKELFDFVDIQIIK